MDELARVDAAKRRIFLRFEGFLSLEQALELKDAYRRAIESVGSGYTVLTFFKDFKPGTPEIQEVLTSMVQMASREGCRKAARVTGDSVLGPYQLRRLADQSASYPHRNFQTLEEAEAYLDSDEDE